MSVRGSAGHWAASDNTQELVIEHYFNRGTMIENQFGLPDFHLGRFEGLTLAD